MKMRFTALLTCLLITAFCFIGCSDEPIPDQTHSPYEDFELVIDDDHVVLVGYTGNDPHVIIPAEYSNGMPITEINYRAFGGCAIESVTIPDTITTIGDYAFYYCKQLTSIYWGANVSSVGKFAFTNCDSLTELYIPNTITSMGVNAFAGNAALTTLVFEEGITRIGDGAAVFGSNVSLEHVEIPDGVAELGHYAFSNCTNLKSVTFLGDAPTTVGNDVFDDCAEDLVIYYTDGTSGWDQTALAEYDLQVAENKK